MRKSRRLPGKPLSLLARPRRPSAAPRVPRSRKQFAGLGREIVTKLLERHKVEFSDKQMATAVPRLGHKNVDDALAAVGKGDLSAADILKALGITVDEADVQGGTTQADARRSPTRLVPRPFRCAGQRRAPC